MIEIWRGEAHFRGRDVSEVTGWAASGKVLPTDMIFDPNVGSWMAAAQHTEIARGFVAPTQNEYASIIAPGPKWSLWKVGCVLVAVIAAVFVAVQLGEPKSKVGGSEVGSGSARANVGEMARLTIDSGMVLVCNERRCLEEFQRAAEIGDDFGTAAPLLQKRAFVVPSGTSALVIGSEYGVRQVRIQEGQFIGRAGWVFADRAVRVP